MPAVICLLTFNLTRKLFEAVADKHLSNSSARIIFESHGAFPDVNDVITLDDFARVSAARNFQGVVRVPVVNCIVSVTRFVLVDVEGAFVAVNFIVSFAAVHGRVIAFGSSRRKSPSAVLILLEAREQLFCQQRENLVLAVSGVSIRHVFKEIESVEDFFHSVLYGLYHFIRFIVFSQFIQDFGEIFLRHRIEHGTQFGGFLLRGFTFVRQEFQIVEHISEG